MRTEIQEIPIDLNREYTLAEYQLIEDDGNRYELIEGKLVMQPAPKQEHGNLVNKLNDALRDYLKANPGTGDTWVTTGFNLGKKTNGKDNVLEPDIGFLTQNRIPSDESGYLPYPDLAIEVWSRDSDLGRPSLLKKAREKLQIYLAAGTSLAWGINPANDTVEVYYRDPQKPPKILTVNDELDGAEIIKGFKMPLTRLFS